MISPGLVKYMRSLAFYKGLSVEETERLIRNVCVRDAVATCPVGMTDREVVEDYWIFYSKYYNN